MPAGDLSALGAELRRIGTEAGLDAVGIAPAAPFAATRRHLEERRADGFHGGMQFTYRNPARSTDPSRLVRGAAALVVGARRYQRVSHEQNASGPQGRVARYSWRDHYAPLREALQAVASKLTANGYRAKVVADDNALVDREAAYRAGLGWYGKNTNLLLPGRGSWFVLGAVVTDALLPTNREPGPDGCGACTRCLPACPTGALISPGILDARRCLAWLVQAPGVFPVEYRVALGDRMYGCDDCQEVCPVNLKAERSDPPPAADPDDEPAVDVLAILNATDEELLRRYGRWYIPQREPRYLRRNALIILGNIGRPDDPDVVDALRRALKDPDPLLRAHAVWAAARLGHHHLIESVTSDTDPIVRCELARVPTTPRVV